MKKLKIYKISLRARITIVTMLMISVIAVAFTFITMYSANYLVFSATDTPSALSQAPLEPMDPANAASSDVLVEPASNVYLFAPGFDAQMLTVPASTVLQSQDAEPLLPAAQFAAEADSVPAQVVSISSSFADGVFSVSPAITLAVQDFNILLLVIMMIIVAVGGLVTWLALGGALRPVKRLSEEIGGIGENDLSVRISDFKAGDEINRLADSFNHMLERLDKAFAGQKGFASAAAHELKTPLSAIKANIEVLEIEKEPDAEEYAQTISVVKKQTERMISLVDELLELASGKEQAVERLELAPILRESAKSLAHTAAEREIEIVLDVPDDCCATANRELLRRAAENIISNAVKYGKHGSRVFLRAEQTNTDVLIRVIDSGPGVPEQDRERIFEPFFRVDTSRSRKAGGAGLGLAIAQDALIRQGGKLEYLENPEGGSIFQITLLR